MKIDWGKPLREKDPILSPTKWKFVGKSTTYPDYPYLCESARGVFARFDEDGRAMNAANHCVENNPEPQEPEREEGLYWIDCTGGADPKGYRVWHFGNGLWTDHQSRQFPDKHVNIPDSAIHSRAYRPIDFRPADSPTGGPPLDGTPFEVEGFSTEVSASVRGNSPYFLVFIDFDGPTFSRSLRWLEGRRWRPAQP